MAPFTGLRIGPSLGTPPVPVRLPGKRWSNWALHGIVRHCAERWIGPGRTKKTVYGFATLPIIVRFSAQEEKEAYVHAVMERALTRGSKGHPGMTPKNLLNYVGKKLAWELSMALSYGYVFYRHRVPIKGIWILHEPSNTKTWLPATPARRPPS